MTKWFRRLRGLDAASITDTQRREALSRTIGLCPFCQARLTGHLTATLAYVVSNEDRENRVTQLRTLIDARAWNELARRREWQPTSDLLEARYLECPTGSAGVLLIDLPFELWARDSVVWRSPVGEDDRTVLHAQCEGALFVL